MAKMKWAISGSEVEEADDSSSFSPYEGPDLKTGVFPVVIEDLRTKKFNSGNEGLEIRLRVKAPKGHNKAAYDGAPIWERFPVIDSMKWKVKQFLVALGGTGKDIDNTVQDNDRKVTRLGRIGDPIGKELRVALKAESYLNEETGERSVSMKVARFMPKSDEDVDAAADAEPEEKPAKAKVKKSKDAAPEAATKPKKSKKKADEDPPF